MRLALEKYMNFNKRGFKQLAAARQSFAITQCSDERESKRERKTKGKLGGENSQCNCNPSSQLLTTTVINYDSSLATAVIAN